MAAHGHSLVRSLAAGRGGVGRQALRCGCLPACGRVIFPTRAPNALFIEQRSCCCVPEGEQPPTQNRPLVAGEPRRRQRTLEPAAAVHQQNLRVGTRTDAERRGRYRRLPPPDGSIPDLSIRSERFAAKTRAPAPRRSFAACAGSALRCQDSRGGRNAVVQRVVSSCRHCRSRSRPVPPQWAVARPRWFCRHIRCWHLVTPLWGGHRDRLWSRTPAARGTLAVELATGPEH